MDEVELGLNLTAAQVMKRRAVLIQDQVLSVGPKPMGRQDRGLSLVGTTPARQLAYSTGII